jgi:trigger factor
MKIEIGKTEGVRRTITLTAEAPEVAAIKKGAIDAARKYVKVPGFRPGKAPDVLVLQRAKDTVDQEFRSHLRGQALRHVKLFHGSGDILAIANMEIPEAVDGEALSISVKIDLRPEFELPDYNHISLPAFSEPEISEEEIDAELLRVMEKEAKLEAVADGRPIAENDVVEIAVRCMYPDGSDVFSGDDPIKVVRVCPRDAEASEFPAVARGVVGLAPGADVTIPFTFSEQYECHELRGKSAIAACYVGGVFTRKMSTTEEYARKNGFGDVQKLREHTRREIQLRKTLEQRGTCRDRIVKFLCDSVDFPLPMSVLEKDAVELLTRHMQKFSVYARTEEEKLELLKPCIAMAGFALKKNFILEAIARKEAIEVSSEDFGRYLYAVGQMQGFSPDAMVRILKKDESLLLNMRKECLLQKTLDMLLEWNLHGRPSANSSKEAPSVRDDDPHSALVPKKNLQPSRNEASQLAKLEVKPTSLQLAACATLSDGKSTSAEPQTPCQKPTDTGAIACAGPGPVGDKPEGCAESADGEPIVCTGPTGVDPTACVRDWGEKD